ncbi:hypothetical protein FD754_025359 [Muntiacus muntjak]|uniref:Immunoglobulin V-set domain-containing protein n=1 Tax=Muntiacus muntjak TaxID=9888 RepID=A0A5N3UKH0_MUNMU|nr:hypothetical protein FD754_025359 [Muntiacus muntjak]
MGSRLLCCVTLCFLGQVNLVYSEVTQTPKYLIKSRKQQVRLRCSPESGHRSGPQFLIQCYNREINEKGMISDRFSGEQFSDLCLELNLGSTLYLCASSQETALHDQVPLGQKHSCPSSGSGGECVDCQPGKPSFWWSRQSSPDVHFLIYFNAHKDHARYMLF